jgi:hypothetical protein
MMTYHRKFTFHEVKHFNTEKISKINSISSEDRAIRGNIR